MNHCVTCSRQVRDYRLCEVCTGRLEQLIAELPALDRELELTETRQTALGPRNGSRSAEKPVVFNPTAAQVRQDLRDTLTGWTADLPAAAVALTVEALSRRFLRHLPAIRQWENADTFTDELGYAVRQGWKCVDRPKDRARVKVSNCLDPSCPGELHAHIPVEDYDPDDDSTHSKIVCTVCEVIYPPVQWYHLGKRLLALLAAA